MLFDGYQSDHDDAALSGAAERMRKALDDASHGLIEREVLVELVALSAVAREHLLVIGPPGTAKSAAVRRVAERLGGGYFEYLLGRFTEPSELFGPVDLRRLQEGEVVTATEGMLPEAEIAFLDEVFKGSTAILNTLLGILAERRFRRGHTALDCPLRLAVGAANEIPTDPSLAAFGDRFLVRLFVEPIADALLEDLLEGGWRVDHPRAHESVAKVDDLDILASVAFSADLEAVRPLLARALRSLRSAGILLSDRRAVKSQRLVAAAAVLDGRRHPDGRDLWPLVFTVPDEEQQRLAREGLADLLEDSRSAALAAAAEDASGGSLARAERLARLGAALLDQAADDVAGDHVPGDDHGFRLKLEGLAREIDASFAIADLPDSLAAVRERLVSALSADV